MQFLDNMRSEINAPSTSALVERIIDDLQGKAELEKIDAQLKAHYDSRPERSIQEDQTWGTIGESTLESIADDESSVRRASIASER